MLPHTTASSRKVKKFVRLNPRLEKQVGAYATAVGATAVAVLAAGPLASAEIIYTPANVTLGPGGSYAIDLNGDGISDFTLRICRCGSGSHTSWLLLGLDVPGNAARPPLGGERGAGALPVGAFIDNKQAFASGTSYGGIFMAFGFAYGNYNDQGGPWLDTSNRYLGLKFMINGEIHYGWARLSVNSFHFLAGQATLTGYAYQTVPGRMIHAGQKTEQMDVETVPPGTDSAPESTLGMLALGTTRLTASSK